jgi:hypothetical protein
LVVVLVGILLPAVLGVRESAQRSACSAKQVRLALGISRFNAAKEYLPGAREGTATWFATIRPYMDGNETAAICPAGMKVTTISNWLTYGINAGTYFTSASSSSIHDGALISNQGTTRKSLDDIRVRDGLSTTWLTGDSMSHKVGKNDVGHSWTASDHKAGILGFRTYPPCRINDWGSPPGNVPAPYEVPPRSVHPGGVVLTFCDGRSKFVKEDIPTYVYAHLTTSYSSWSETAYDPAINTGRAIFWLTENLPPEENEPVRVKEGDHF